MLRNVVGIAVALFAGMLMQAGASSHAEEKTNQHVDDKFDFSLTVPETWKTALLQDYTVPGVTRTAYAGNGGASIVVFIQEPGKAFDPRFIIDQSAKSMEEKLGATVREKEVRTIDGKKAMWLTVEGKGTGGSIDGKGSVKTTQQWLAVPREKDIVVVLMTTPTADFEQNEKSFGEAIKSLKVGGSQSEEQRQSK